jgi:hypothetical protein
MREYRPLYRGWGRSTCYFSLINDLSHLINSHMEFFICLLNLLQKWIKQVTLIKCWRTYFLFLFCCKLSQRPGSLLYSARGGNQCHEHTKCTLTTSEIKKNRSFNVKINLFLWKTGGLCLTPAGQDRRAINIQMKIERSWLQKKNQLLMLPIVPTSMPGFNHMVLFVDSVHQLFIIWLPRADACTAYTMEKFHDISYNIRLISLAYLLLSDRTTAAPINRKQIDILRWHPRKHLHWYCYCLSKDLFL